MQQQFHAVLLLLLIFLLPKSLNAQSDHNLWLRTTIRLDLQNKFSTAIEWQHRRQSSYTDKSAWATNLLYSFRHWLFYKKSEQLTLSLSPFAYFRHFSYSGQGANFSGVQTTELGFSMASRYKYQLQNEHFHIFNRAAVESRHFNRWSNHSLRIRNRIGLVYQITTSYKISLYNEILVNAYTTRADNFFDQNRVGMQLEYTLKTLQCTIGYIYIDKTYKALENLKQENNYILQLSYQLPSIK